MPRKRLPMRKIREALRLKAAGLTMREVAANIGAAPATVHEYLVRAETAGLSWPLPEDLDEEALEALLFPPPTGGPARPVPDWREVHRELRSRSRAAHGRLPSRSSKLPGTPINVVLTGRIVPDIRHPPNAWRGTMGRSLVRRTRRGSQEMPVKPHRT